MGLGPNWSVFIVLKSGESIVKVGLVSASAGLSVPGAVKHFSVQILFSFLLGPIHLRIDVFQASCRLL